MERCVSCCCYCSRRHHCVVWPEFSCSLHPPCQIHQYYSSHGNKEHLHTQRDLQSQALHRLMRRLDQLIRRTLRLATTLARAMTPMKKPKSLGMRARICPRIRLGQRLRDSARRPLHLATSLTRNMAESIESKRLGLSIWGSNCTGFGYRFCQGRSGPFGCVAFLAG